MFYLGHNFSVASWSAISKDFQLWKMLLQLW